MPTEVGQSLSPRRTTQLMYACSQGDLGQVKRILQNQPNSAVQRDRTLKTALHYCAGSSTRGGTPGVGGEPAHCADLLVMAAPALVDTRDEDGFTPLHLAVISGNMQLVHFLLANGADINALDAEKHSVVHWATVCGETGALNAVLSAGANVSTPDVHGGYPLHYAAQMCGSEKDELGLQVLHILLAQPGISVVVEDNDGRQPLLWAASAGSARAVLALVRAGAAVETADRDGLTALHCAASRGHTDTLDTLLTLCGATPDVIDTNGCTALHYSVTLGHADATALLLSHGADPNRQDRKGRSPAHCGCAKGQLETVRQLGAHGANLWLRNARGDLPLHEAAASGRRPLIRWLLDQRPSQANARNNDGRCPLHLAALNDNADMCKILLDAGAQVNPILRTSKNVFMTPLDCALQRGFRSTAKFLQLNGGVPANRLSTVKVGSEVTAHVSSSSNIHIREDIILVGDSSSETEVEESRPRRRTVRRRIAYKYDRKRGQSASGSDPEKELYRHSKGRSPRRDKPVTIHTGSMKTLDGKLSKKYERQGEVDALLKDGAGKSYRQIERENGRKAKQEMELRSDGKQFRKKRQQVETDEESLSETDLTSPDSKLKNFKSIKASSSSSKHRKERSTPVHQVKPRLASVTSQEQEALDPERLKQRLEEERTSLDHERKSQKTKDLPDDEKPRKHVSEKKLKKISPDEDEESSYREKQTRTTSDHDRKKLRQKSPKEGSAEDSDREVGKLQHKAPGEDVLSSDTDSRKLKKYKKSTMSDSDHQKQTTDSDLKKKKDSDLERREKLSCQRNDSAEEKQKGEEEKPTEEHESQSSKSVGNDQLLSPTKIQEVNTERQQQISKEKRDLTDKRSIEEALEDSKHISKMIQPDQVSLQSKLSEECPSKTIVVEAAVHHPPKGIERDDSIFVKDPKLLKEHSQKSSVEDTEVKEKLQASETGTEESKTVTDGPEKSSFDKGTELPQKVATSSDKASLSEKETTPSEKETAVAEKITEVSESKTDAHEPKTDAQENAVKVHESKTSTEETVINGAEKEASVVETREKVQITRTDTIAEADSQELLGPKESSFMYEDKPVVKDDKKCIDDKETSKADTETTIESSKSVSKADEGKNAEKLHLPAQTEDATKLHAAKEERDQLQDSKLEEDGTAKKAVDEKETSRKKGSDDTDSTQREEKKPPPPEDTEAKKVTTTKEEVLTGKGEVKKEVSTEKGEAMEDVSAGKEGAKKKASAEEVDANLSKEMSAEKKDHSASEADAVKEHPTAEADVKKESVKGEKPTERTKKEDAVPKPNELNIDLSLKKFEESARLQEASTDVEEDTLERDLPTDESKSRKHRRKVKVSKGKTDTSSQKSKKDQSVKSSEAPMGVKSTEKDDASSGSSSTSREISSTETDSEKSARKKSSDEKKAKHKSFKVLHDDVAFEVLQDSSPIKETRRTKRKSSKKALKEVDRIHESATSSPEMLESTRGRSKSQTREKESRISHTNLDSHSISLPALVDTKRPDSNLSAPNLSSVYSDNEQKSGSNSEVDELISSASRKRRFKRRTKLRVGSKSAGSDYESSNLIDSGFEPSPRSSRIPKRKVMSERGVNMASVTQTIQSNIRRYHMERKLFQHLLDLKRLQIRSGQANETMLVKRAIDAYHNSVAATVGAGRYTKKDYSYRSFEQFLYQSLRMLQKTPPEHLRGLPETPDNPLLCTQSTHRCLHATHAYTGIPCAAYIPKMNHHTMPKIGFTPRSSTSFLPQINSKGKSVTLELCHGNDKQVISLPADRLDHNKRYYVTFTVKGQETHSPTDQETATHRHAKSV